MDAAEARRLELEHWRRSRQNPAALKGGPVGGRTVSQENLPAEQRRRASTSSASLTTSRPPLLRVESLNGSVDGSLDGASDCDRCAQLQAQLKDAQTRAAQATEVQSTLLSQRDTARAELDHVLGELNAALRSEEEAHAAGAELRAELKAVQEDQAMKTAALQAAQEDLSAKKAALQAAQAALQAALVSEEEAHAASAALRAELAAAREELSAKCASLQAALSELTSNNATMQAALDAAVATSQAQAAALQAAEDVAASERLAASARFADAEAQCAALKEQLRRAQRAVSAAEARAREACSRCEQLAMELEVLRGSAVSAASGDVVMLDAELQRAHAAHAVQLEQAQRERAEAEARLGEMQRVMETQAAEEERWRTEFEQAAQEDMENALADLRQQYEQLLESAASSWQRGEGEPTASQSPRRVSRLAQVLATTPVKGATAAAFLASPPPQKQQRRVHTEPIVIHDIPDAPPMPLRLRAVGAAFQAEVIAAGPGAWLIMCSFVASLGQQSPAVLMAAVLLAAGGIIARTVQHR